MSNASNFDVILNVRTIHCLPLIPVLVRGGHLCESHISQGYIVRLFLKANKTLSYHNLYCYKKIKYLFYAIFFISVCRCHLGMFYMEGIHMCI